MADITFEEEKLLEFPKMSEEQMVQRAAIKIQTKKDPRFVDSHEAASVVVRPRLLTLQKPRTGYACNQNLTSTSNLAEQRRTQ